MKLSRASIALLLIQLAIVSSIAGKYLYQRWACPKVWTRAVAYDPELVMRGRYLSMQLHIDACGIKLPLSQDKSMASQDRRAFFVDASGDVSEQLPVFIAVHDGRLIAQRVATPDEEHTSQDISIQKAAVCSQAFLQKAVEFYISDTATSPFPLEKGSELWVEVTVPPKGPPRPIAMATKDSEGHWQPLNYR